MAKSNKSMNYRKASAGSGRGISSDQWNGFLQMHKDIYAGNVGDTPLPPILSKSIVAEAVLAEDSKDIEPFAPCRIVRQVSLSNITSDVPSYVVEAVDTADTPKHGNYAFSVNEGVRAEKGGRIIIAGIAIVAVPYEDLDQNSANEEIDTGGESSYYLINDKTLSQSAEPIAPVGHFKIVSWYDRATLNDEYEVLYVAVDMAKRPTSFLATVDATIDASTEAAGTTTMSSGAAYAFYILENDETAGTIGVEKDDTAYEITVYNTSAEAIPSGDHLLSYSLEYNRFIVLVASGQTVKIGKADADIAVDATGTISIWRDGVDTTENEEAKLDWMAGTTQVSLGKEVMITWFADEAIWRITGAECEDE